MFSNLIEDLSSPFKQMEIDTIAGIESFGFILGSAITQKLGKGFLPIRKGGKLACISEVIDRRKLVDYNGIEKALELKKDSIRDGEKFLLADEWADTCSQMDTAISLIEDNGKIIKGITLIGIEHNSRTKKLMKKYNVRSIGYNPYC